MFTNDTVTADSRRPDLNAHQMKKALGKLFFRLSTIAFLLSTSREDFINDNGKIQGEKAI